MTKQGRLAIIVTAIALALLVGAGALFLGLSGKGVSNGAVAAIITEDSGVVACKAIAENQKKPSASPSKGNKPEKKMTEKELKEQLKPFENSKHTDIKVAGTGFINTAYKLDNLSDDALGDGLALVSQLSSTYSSLAIACANHGVTLQPTLL